MNLKPRLAIELPQSILGVGVFRCYERNCYSSPLRRWTAATYKVHVHGVLLFDYVSRPPRYLTRKGTNNRVSSVVVWFCDGLTVRHYTKDLFDAVLPLLSKPS